MCRTLNPNDSEKNDSQNCDTTGVPILFCLLDVRCDAGSACKIMYKFYWAKPLVFSLKLDLLQTVNLDSASELWDD